MGGEGGATEDDRVGDGHEFEQAPGVLLTYNFVYSDGHRSLTGYSPRGRKESDTTEQLTDTVVVFIIQMPGQHMLNRAHSPNYILFRSLRSCLPAGSELASLIVLFYEGIPPRVGEW